MRTIEGPSSALSSKVVQASLAAQQDIDRHWQSVQECSGRLVASRTQVSDSQRLDDLSGMEHRHPVS